MTYGLAFTEYASLMDATDRNIESHTLCAADGKCLSVNFQSLNVGPRHVVETCSCQVIRPSSDKIRGILASSRIPLINLGSLSTEMPECPVVEWDRQHSYIAFSHVWTDGLSSDSETGLPLCQLRNLREILLKVESSPLVWIDALCIPHKSTSRSHAIELMADVYKQSKAIIILDAGLRSRRLGQGSSTAELAVRLLTCDWMHCLWTLLKILFSSRAYVAFQDGVFDLQILRDNLKDVARYPIECVGYCTLLRLVRGDGTDGLTIGITQRLIASRNSSRPDDETLAIAPLFNLKAADLIGHEGQSRMAQFWRLLHEVPRIVIFLTCPRLDIQGFTWAPLSLMSTLGDVPMNHEYGFATVTSLGLRGTFFLYEFRTRRLLEDTASLIIDPKAQQFIAFKHKFNRTQTYPYQCDGIVMLEESTNALKRFAITVVTDPAQGFGARRYRYGRQLVLDFSPLPVSQDLSTHFPSIGKY